MAVKMELELKDDIAAAIDGKRGEVSRDDFVDAVLRRAFSLYAAGEIIV